MGVIIAKEVVCTSLSLAYDELLSLEAHLSLSLSLATRILVHSR